MKEQSLASQLTLFVGIILTLIGLYGVLRIGVNLQYFPKYPTAGIYALPGQYPYYGPGPREEDCEYYPPYLPVPLTIPAPPATETEVVEDSTASASKQPEPDLEENKKRCLDGVGQSRESAKVNDISQAGLFLFLGLGLLISHRMFFRK